MQLQIFSSSFPGDKPASIREILSYLKGLSEGQKAFYKQICWIARLIIVLPSTNASSERAFSAMKRLKTYLRSTMCQPRLNHVMILEIYREEFDRLDLTAAASEFIRGSEHRLRIFGNYYYK